MTHLPLSAALTTAFLVTSTVSSAQTPDLDACGAFGFQGLVGQSAEIAVMLVLEQPTRVITPRSVVTRGYRQERINFLVDDDNRITQVYCG